MTTTNSSPNVIEIRPERITPRGRRHSPDYLHRFNYPGLLTGKAVTITTTTNPDDALTYSSADSLDAALALLRSIGHDDPRVVPLASAGPEACPATGRSAVACSDPSHAGCYAGRAASLELDRKLEAALRAADPSY